MTLQEYYDVKYYIEKEYRYHCLESSFRHDPQYADERAKWKALYNQLHNWQSKTLEKALSGIDASFFKEV